MNIEKELDALRDRLYKETLEDIDDNQVKEHLKKEYKQDWSDSQEQVIDIMLDSIGS